MEAPVVCRTNQLNPIAMRYFFVLSVRCDLAEMQPAIAIPEFGHRTGIHPIRHVARVFDGIQVRQKRNRKPVVARDAIVTANDDPAFSGLAHAKLYRRFGAHTRQIDSGVSGGIECSKRAERLSDQKSHFRFQRRMQRED